MKNWLAKLSFKDAPAQGAFFAITLWGLGLYVIFSLMLALTGSGFVPIVWVTQGLSIILTIYFGLMLFRFYNQSCRTVIKRATAFWTAFTLYIIIATASVYDGGAVGFAVMTMLFGTWLFPLLLIPKIRWYCYLVHALSWTLGTLLLIAILIRSIAERNGIFGIPSVNEPSYYTKLIADYVLSDGGWIFGVISCLLLLLAGYLLTAKILSDAWSVPYRRMFGKGVLTLWGLSIATYLVFLVMANIASRQAAQDIKDLEQRFGRPMTAAALGKLYYGNDRPDPEFWQKIEKYCDQCDTKVDTIDFGYYLDTVPAQLLTRWHQQFDNSELAAWEQAFTGDIPPEARQYEPGTLTLMEFYSPRLLWKFSQLELWRIRFALMDNNIKDALAAYSRITNAANALLRETDIIFSLVWMGCQNIRLNALRLLLESGNLSNAQLQTFAADLQTAEKQIPTIHERCLYGEAVSSIDFFEMIGCGFGAIDSRYKTAPYQTLRFLMPQLWWYAANDKSDTARYYNIKNFDEAANISPRKNNFRISDLLLPELKPDAAIFNRLTARLRAAGVIIRAVEYQKQHGEYPKTLDDLPANPFTGKPLQYCVGDCEIQIRTAVKDKNSWYAETLPQSVPAIRCWGLEPDHQYQIDFTVRIKR